MTKIAGMVLILLSSALYGFILRAQLNDHLKQVIGMKEVLLMLRSEITYAKTPLSEAFLHIANQGKEPFSSLLNDVRERMICPEQTPLSNIWREELSKHKKDFLFTEEEYEMFENAGDNFGYLDWEMQIKNIDVYIQQIEVKIVQSQNELTSKQKIYQYLSLMGGLFLIIILI